MTLTASSPLPKYKCHKEVWAIKIKQIDPIHPPHFSGTLCRGAVSLGTACNNCERCRWYAENLGVMIGGAFITPEDPRYAGFEVDRNYVEKHKPQIGGYYVVYEDGYKSFSPAAAFEDGYSLMGTVGTGN